MRSPRRTIRELGVIGVVLALALGIVFAAVQAEGRRTVRPQTNDGGAWLINSAEGVVGHLNRGVGEVTGVVRFAEPGDDIDTEQSGEAVLAINNTSNLVSIIDQRSFQTIKRVETPSNLRAQLDGNTAILWTESPLRIWRLPVDELSQLDQLGEVTPVIVDSESGQAVVTRFGTILAVAPESQRFVRLEPESSEPTSIDLGPVGADVVALGASGNNAVFTTEAGSLLTIRSDADLPGEPEAMGAVAVLAQPSLPGEPVIGIASIGTILSTRLDGQPAISVGDISGSDPLPPLVHGACVYVVATRPAALTKSCGGEVVETAPLTGSTGASLRVRLVNNWVWINDLSTGTAWVVNETAPLDRIDDWGAALGTAEGDGQESDQVGNTDVEQRENPDALDALVIRADELDEDGINEPPVARPDTATTRTDLPIVVDVLANDEDPDGDVLLVTATTAGPEGSIVQLTGDHRAVQVTPRAGSTETIRFVYTISDGRGGEDSAEVTVTVLEATGVENRPPLAVTDAVTARAGSSVALNVLDNDTDPDGDSIVLTDVRVPSGTVSFDGGGQLTYIPDPSTGEGTLDLDYTIADTFGADANGIIRVSVRLSGSNTEPDARNDSAVTVEGNPVVVNVLRNDDDPDGDAINVSGPPTLVAPLDGSGSAEFSLSADGQLFFVADQAGEYLLRYTISDGSERDAAIVRVDVEPAVENRPPIAVRDDVTIPRGGSASVFALANDSDPDGDVIAVDGWAPSSAAFTDPDNPALVSDPIEVESLRGVGFVVNVAADAPDQVRFNYTVTDGINEPVTGVVVIVVTNSTSVNQAPVTTRDVIEVRPNGSATARVLLNDYDPEGGGLQVTSASNVDGVRMRIGPDAQEIIVAVDDTVATGFTFTYEVTDQAGLTAAEFVDVRLVPNEDENRPPVARADTARTRAATSVDIPVLDNDSDPDGDVIRVESISAQPAGGSADVNDDGTITYVPDPAFAGTDSFRYVLLDQFGDRDIGDVLVGVIPVAVENRPPTAVDDLYELVAGTDSVLLDVTENDSDPDGDTLSIVRTSGGPALSINASNTGVLFTPAVAIEAERVDVTFTYRIDDGRGETDDATVTVTILQTIPLVAPVALDDTAGPVREGEEITVAVIDNDTDPDGRRDDLTISSDDGLGRLSGGPGSLTFTAGSETSTHPYTITDADGLTSQAIVTLLVTENVAPTASPLTVETAFETPVTINLGAQASDIDNDDLFFVCCDSPRGGSTEVVTSGPGVMTMVFTPQPEFDGQAGFAYVVNDGRGHEVAASVSVLVLPKENGAPTAASAEIQVEAGTTGTIALAPLTDDEDLPTGDVLTYSLGSVSDDGITLAGDTVAIVAGIDTAGAQRNFEYSVTDALGETASAQVSITVTESALPPPIAVADTGKTTQGIEVTVDVLANDLDERGEGLRIIAAGTATPLGTITSSEASASISFRPADGFFGTAQISYTIEDARRTANGRATGSLEIDVVGFPDAPPTPEAVADNATASITWGQPAANGGPIEEFEIEGDQGQLDLLGPSSSHSYTGLVNGDEHRFRVRARNEAGWGEWSQWSAPVVPDTLPGRPSAPTLSFADGALDVTWAEPANDGSAIIGYDLEIGGGLTTNIELSNVTAHTWPSLNNGTNYQFRIRAINEAGLSDVSAWSASEHPLREPDAPSPVTTTQGDRFLDLAWSAPFDNGDPITAYQVEMESDPGNPASTPDPGFRWANLPNGDFQRFRTRAMNRDDDWSQWSGWSNAERPCGEPLAATAPSVTRGDTLVNLTWSAPDDNGCPISSYTVEAVGTGLTQTVSQFAGSHTFSGLSNGTSYTFRIIANNSVGVGDLGAVSVAVTPAGPPFAPTGLVADPWNDADKVFFQLNAPGNNGDSIIRYDLRINGGGVETAPVTNVSSTFPSGIRTGLAANTTYNFQVRACNNIGCGSWSNTDAATTYGPPNPVSSLVGSNFGANITFTWNPPAVTGPNQSISGTYTNLATGASRSVSYGSSQNSATFAPPDVSFNGQGRLDLQACNDTGCSFVQSATGSSLVPATVTAYKGAATSIPECNTASCAYIGVNAINLYPSQSYNMYCLRENNGATFGGGAITSNPSGSYATSQVCIFGFPGEPVSVQFSAGAFASSSNTLIW